MLSESGTIGLLKKIQTFREKNMNQLDHININVRLKTPFLKMSKDKPLSKEDICNTYCQPRFSIECVYLYIQMSTNQYKKLKSNRYEQGLYKIENT